jgi:hypothetical protein
MKAHLATVNDLIRRFMPFLQGPVEWFTDVLHELTGRIVTRGFMSLRLNDDTRLELQRDLGRRFLYVSMMSRTTLSCCSFETAGDGAKEPKTVTTRNSGYSISRDGPLLPS